MRRAKENTQKKWRKEWRAETKTGRFAISNRIEPSLKKTMQFTLLHKKREIFGRLVQCRTGHAYIGEYYSKFVPSKNTDCICGEPLQTREHILRECPEYEAHRNILRKFSRDISIPEILGTKDGIYALAEFLEESGAFTRTGNVFEKRKTPKWEEEADVEAESDQEELGEEGVETEDFG